MKSLWIYTILVAAFLVAGNLHSIAQTPERLYQKGLMKEEGEGKLEEAINLYSQIADNSEADQSLRAKALLHIGMCYERMGTQEAVEAYQRLVTNFPSQENEVAIAKERLSSLLLIAEKVSETPLLPKFTKLEIPTELSWCVKLSPDGKDLALVSDKKLWKMPLSGNLGSNFPGTPVQLNTEGIEVGWWGLSWSGDGKWIAFNERPLNNKPSRKIFIVSSDGGKPKKIANPNRYTSEPVANLRLSLSPEGKKIAFSSVENNTKYAYTTQVIGGSTKQLVAFQAREPVFSPDGKMIAFAGENPESSEGELGLWIIPAQGGTPHLLADAGKASSPVWSPDGKMVAFLDNNHGNQINIISVSSGGEAVGKVNTIDVPEGIKEVRLLAGWTPDNKIGALFTTNQKFALYTVPSDGGQAAIILKDTYALQPRWSSDNNKIYYTASVDEDNQSWKKRGLAVVSAEGGKGTILTRKKDAKIEVPFGYQAGNRVSPDGKMIVSAAKLPNASDFIKNYPCTQIWKIPIDGSNPIKITNPQDPYTDIGPCWSPDGKKVAFQRLELVEGNGEEIFGDGGGIYIVDSSGGEPKLLISKSGQYFNSLVWSPDGKMIAYLSADKKGINPNAINVINVSNNETRVVGKVTAANVNIELAWSPDSKRIAFNSFGNVIKVMSLSDGSIEQISTALADVRIHHLDWSPDGKRFVFGGVKKKGEAEFWFLEDFLPLESLQQNPETTLAEEPEGIKIKQIWKTPYLDDIGTVSADGRFRSYVHWGNGDVAVHNLISGEKKILTHEADLGDPTHFAEYTVISKNGNKIAYSWWNPHNTNDLRLIDVDKPSPSLLYGKKGEGIHPIIWLSDKELVVLRSIHETGTTQVISFNVLDKTEQVLKTFKGAWPQLSCSPDEKYLAYDFPKETDDGNYDINIMLANGDKDISLISHPANDRVLGWVPGRQEFLFTSDRSGSWDLWAIPLDDGKPSGPAKKIYTDIGAVQPMGFTDNGDCYFGFSKRNFSAYLTPFNAENGKLNEKEGKSLLGSNFWVKWSPDGQSLAYISENTKSENHWQLTIKDLKNGQERKFAENLFLARSPCWSPDGKSILVLGHEKSKFQFRPNGYKGSVFLVDVRTGQTTEILRLSDYKFNVPDDEASPLSDLEWSADGKSFYYLFFKDRLVKHDLETGEDKVLYKQADFDRGSLSRSPDGKMLIFAARSPEEKKSRLFTIPVEGGQAKELCTPQEADALYGVLWSPDGKYIYFAERQEGTNLWRIPAEGGTPQKIWHSENGVELLSIHPDGNQIAFSIRERTTEIRLIENLSYELAKVYDKSE